MFVFPTEVYPMNEVGNISVKAGDSVSVPCLYDSKYREKYKYLCEGISLSSCSSKRRHTPQNSGEDLDSHTKSETIFTVNITAQTDENTHYWCAVKTDDTSDIGHSVLLFVVKGKCLKESLTNKKFAEKISTYTVLSLLSEEICVNYDDYQEFPIPHY